MIHDHIAVKILATAVEAIVSSPTREASDGKKKQL
jgi:hypothetical protein